MHPDLLNILATLDQPIDNEKLIAYLTGGLSAAESREIEEKLASAGLDHDALEGLMLVKDKRKIPDYQHELDLFLNDKLKQPATKRKQRTPPSWIWMALTAAIVIGLILLAWFLINYLSNK